MNSGMLIPEAAQDPTRGLLKRRKRIAQFRAHKILQEIIPEIREAAGQRRSDGPGLPEAIVGILEPEQIPILQRPLGIIRLPFKEMALCGDMTAGLRNRNKRSRLLPKLRLATRIA
jgi:hypothetical protein